MFRLFLKIDSNEFQTARDFKYQRIFTLEIPKLQGTLISHFVANRFLWLSHQNLKRSSLPNLKSHSYHRVLYTQKNTRTQKRDFVHVLSPKPYNHEI